MKSSACLRFRLQSQPQPKFLGAVTDNLIGSEIEVVEKLNIDIQEDIIFQSGERGGDGVGMKERIEQVTGLGNFLVRLIQLPSPFQDALLQGRVQLNQVRLGLLERV